jgi:hypothetical protein
VPASYWVEIRPRLVATIQRLPQSTIESTLPTPGTVSPRAADQVPFGPSSTTLPPTTSRTVQPSIVVGLVSGTGVVGLVSGTGVGRGKVFVGCAADNSRAGRVEFCSDTIFRPFGALEVACRSALGGMLDVMSASGPGSRAEALRSRGSAADAT